MADSAELAFAKSHLNALGTLPVQYPDDYQQPPHNSLRKIPVIPVDLPMPPTPKTEAEYTSSEVISLSFKSTKPLRTFTFPVSPTDTISAIKTQLATQPGAPPADAQRLLLRGKALADGKLLKEYGAKTGDTVNIMLRPGFEWDWNVNAAPLAATPSPAAGDMQMKLDPSTASTSGRTSRHGRIPSVVLSPSPSASSTSLPLSDPSPIPLTLDVTNISSVTNAPSFDTYHKKISTPDFWERLYEFLKAEFEAPEDADNAFESFLVGSKGYLSPSEIAKIRDTVGVVGMGGT